MSHAPSSAERASLLAEKIDNADVMFVRNCPMFTKFDHENVDTLLSGEEQNLICEALKAYGGVAQAAPVAWRWRPRGATIWIYDPTAEWRADQQKKGADIDIEPLYSAPPQAPSQATLLDLLAKVRRLDWASDPEMTRLRSQVDAALALTRPASPQTVIVTDEMINAAAREIWNDRDARYGGSLDSHDPREVCVIQTKATAKAALTAALSRPEEK